ncbi:MAG: putative signal transducing protein [Vibrio sp.]
MKIFTANNPVEAHIVCELLKSNHIDAEVHSEGIFSLKGEIPLTSDTDPYVWLLDEEKEQQAKRLIEGYLQEEQRPNWICEHCNESVEAQFAVCWNCGETNPKQLD